MTDPRVAAIKAETQELKARLARVDQQNKIQAIKKENAQMRERIVDLKKQEIQEEINGYKRQIVQMKQEAEEAEIKAFEKQYGIFDVTRRNK